MGLASGGVGKGLSAAGHVGTLREMIRDKSPDERCRVHPPLRHRGPADEATQRFEAIRDAGIDFVRIVPGLRDMPRDVGAHSVLASSEIVVGAQLPARSPGGSKRPGALPRYT
ncbi:MAG: hypothetical protein QNK04_31960 [Myxococcota bacterium]|nr:hypothetical protein [Myxococcota bacterium]